MDHVHNSHGVYNSEFLLDNNIVIQYAIIYHRSSLFIKFVLDLKVVFNSKFFYYIYTQRMVSGSEW